MFDEIDLVEKALVDAIGTIGADIGVAVVYQGWPNHIESGGICVLPQDSTYIDWEGAFNPSRPRVNLRLLPLINAMDMAAAEYALKVMAMGLATRLPKTPMATGGYCPAVKTVSPIARVDGAENFFTVEMDLVPKEVVIDG